MRIVGVEEHFVTADVLHAWQALAPERRDAALRDSSEGELGRRLLELGPDRILAMDDAGIDVQVLSLTTPGVQNLDADHAVALAIQANDQLHDFIGRQPNRFQGLATLPMPMPLLAARELERSVLKLGMQGAMLFGRTGSKNLDHPDYWPIFETACVLNVPLYIHPQTPQLGVREAYYSGIGNGVDRLFSTAGIGWHYETGMQIVRMALAGVFERFPDLQIITGHMGEVILFYLDRIDMLSIPASLPRKISEYIQKHVYVTPSGLFTQRYLRWAIEVLGVDHIMISADYPFAEATNVKAFLQQSNLSYDDQLRIASGNWDRLCAGIRRH
jgi:predicted TIM-barrel fold metal-dependent hydrolase